METIAIKSEHIRLGQLLKLADLVDSGAEAKHLIQGGGVRVNGEVEIRRGRKLVAGDRVECGGRQLLVAGTSAGG